MGVYEYVFREEALADPTCKHVGVRRAKANQATNDNPKVRCGLVAQDFAKQESRDDLLAGAPH